MVPDFAPDRSKLTNLQASILKRIRTRYWTSEPRWWPSTQEILIEFGEAEAIAAIRSLPLGAVMETGQQFSLSLLGLLLGDQGAVVEIFLNDYLELVKSEAKRDPRSVDVTSEQMHGAFDMTDPELDLLGLAIERGELHDGINLLNGSRWSFRRPAIVARLVAMDDFSAFLRNQAFELAARSARRESSPADGVGSRPQPAEVDAPSPPAVDLESTAEDLLTRLVEAARSVSEDQRMAFRGIRLHGTGREVVTLMHPGFPGRQHEAYPGDIAELEDEGLLRSYPNKDYKFDVTPKGFRLCEVLKANQGGPTTRVEREVRSFIDQRVFRARHPAGYEKWADAERQLWSNEDPIKSATVIGHLCREAHQAFATSLLAHHPAPGAPDEPDKTKNRVAAVVEGLSTSSESVTTLAKSLTNYWSSVVDLAQRQEHGGQKGGEPLTWEDSRRLVFHTLFAMTEIDRVALGASK